MNEIVSLDCTLRDGGYCNQWRFRGKNIKKIIEGLLDTGVEIIECGFLTNRVEYNADVSKYTKLEQLNSFIPQYKMDTDIVVMINYGEYKLDEIPKSSESCIDGIRVAFHKAKKQEAIEYSRCISKKGYKVYLQPMVTMLYSDEEFLQLIKLANDVNLYAFYLVDSFGTMSEADLLRYYQLAEHNLGDEIALGFHSHNNLQSAFSNARSLIKWDTDRKIIIDSSIYGMGRGAGNLNSELFLNELNTKYKKQYDIKPLLNIMDEIISDFYNEHPWGYSLPNYLSAVHMAHPNYSRFLTEKSSLMLDDIDEIFSMMDSEKTVEYDEDYINEIYLRYMSNGLIRNGHLAELKKTIRGKKVLLIAPGKSVNENSEKIKEFIDKGNPVVISINHEEEMFKTDYVFISNKRRFSQLDSSVYGKTISTSNIKSPDTYVSVDYYSLLNGVESVRDNAGLMSIKFVIDELEPSEIYLAGLDGYSSDARKNYESEDLTVYMPEKLIEKMNAGMRIMIEEYKKNNCIRFITPSLLE